jgi:hypothetical protein
MARGRAVYAAPMVEDAGWRRALPDDNDETRRALYEGRLFQVGSTAASVALVDDIDALLREELGPVDPRHAQRELGEEAFFAGIGRVRRRLFEEAHFHRRVFDVAAACGFDPDAIAFDPVRLRVVSHEGHLNERAAPIYYPHRDTWFALSPAVIAWWIAVHDIEPSESFEVYPDWLARPVDNTSEGFDYDAWKGDNRSLRIGWQDRDAGRSAHYSGTRGGFEPGRVVPLRARRADNVIFAGAHLHRTRDNNAGYTRYSLDFRMVHRDDHRRGLGPPSVDNRSRGSATDDYVGFR